MSDEENELKPVEEQPEETKVLSDNQANKSRFGMWIGFGVLILVLALVAAGVFLLHELRTKQEGLGGELDKGGKQAQELLHQISSLETELATLHSQFANVESQVTTEDSKFERAMSEQKAVLEERLDASKSELGQSIQNIQHQLNKTHGDVMVSDAEYLLSIANQKLHLIGDVKAVLSAMEAADQRLRDSGDPAVFKVREALAEEINQLKHFDAPDVVGLSAKLMALESKVKEMPLFLPHVARDKEDHAAESPSVVPQTEDKFDAIVRHLKELVIIRRTDRPVREVLHPEEVDVLKQVLLLKLEMARASLLRGDDALYKTNLESSRNWLVEHFDADALLVKDAIDQIGSLEASSIQVPFPDIGKSLGLLRNIEKLRLESEVVGKAAKSEKASKPEAGAQP